jgi:hypothetical protein
VTALQDMLESRGHILVTCVKCHPELAGCGVEYSWGKSKMEFRKKNTGENKRANLLQRVIDSLDTGGSGSSKGGQGITGVCTQL